MPKRDMGQVGRGPVLEFYQVPWCLCADGVMCLRGGGGRLSRILPGVYVGVVVPGEQGVATSLGRHQIRRENSPLSDSDRCEFLFEFDSRRFWLPGVIWGAGGASP